LRSHFRFLWRAGGAKSTPCPPRNLRTPQRNSSLRVLGVSASRRRAFCYCFELSQASRKARSAGVG
jgi:hypothetical protein